MKIVKKLIGVNILEVPKWEVSYNFRVEVCERECCFPKDFLDDYRNT